MACADAKEVEAVDAKDSMVLIVGPGLAQEAWTMRPDALPGIFQEIGKSADALSRFGT